MAASRPASPGAVVAGEVAASTAVARRLGRSREWVYRHADELGAVRLGVGERPRLGFHPARVAALRRGGLRRHQSVRSSLYTVPPPRRRFASRRREIVIARVEVGEVEVDRVDRPNAHPHERMLSTRARSCSAALIAMRNSLVLVRYTGDLVAMCQSHDRPTRPGGRPPGPRAGRTQRPARILDAL